MSAFVAGAVEREDGGEAQPRTDFDRVTEALQRLTPQERDQFHSLGALIPEAIDLVRHGVIKKGKLPAFLTYIFNTLSQLANQETDVGTTLMKGSVMSSSLLPDQLTGIVDPGTFWWNRFQQEFQRVKDTLGNEMQVERGLTGPFAVYKLETGLKAFIRTSSGRENNPTQTDELMPGNDRNIGVAAQIGIGNVYREYVTNQNRIQEVLDTNHQFAGAGEAEIISQSVAICDAAGVASNLGMYMVDGQYHLRGSPTDGRLRILNVNNTYFDIRAADFIAFPPEVAGALVRGEVSRALTASRNLMDDVRKEAYKQREQFKGRVVVKLESLGLLKRTPNNPDGKNYPPAEIERAIIQADQRLKALYEQAQNAQSVLAPLVEGGKNPLHALEEWDVNAAHQPLLSIRVSPEPKMKNKAHENNLWYHMAGAGRQLATVEFETGLYTRAVEVPNPFDPHGGTRIEHIPFGESIKRVKMHFGHLALDGVGARALLESVVGDINATKLISEQDRTDPPPESSDNTWKKALGFSFKSEVYKYPPEGLEHSDSRARKDLDGMLGFDVAIARILGATEYNMRVRKNDIFDSLVNEGKKAINAAIRIDGNPVESDKIKTALAERFAQQGIPSADIPRLVKMAEQLVTPKQLATWALAASTTAISEKPNAVCAVPGRDAHRLFVSTLGVYGLPMFKEIKGVVFDYVQKGRKFESFVDFWEAFQEEFYARCRKQHIDASQFIQVFANSARLLFQDTAGARIGAGVVPAIDTLSGNAVLKNVARVLGKVLVSEEAPVVDGQNGQISNLGAVDNELWTHDANFMTALASGYNEGIAAIGSNLNVRRRADSALFVESFMRSYDVTHYAIFRDYMKTREGQARLKSDKALRSVMQILGEMMQGTELTKHREATYALLNEDTKYNDKEANVPQRLASFLAEAVSYARREKTTEASYATTLIKQIRADAQWAVEDSAAEIAFLQTLFGAMPYLSRTQGLKLPGATVDTLDTLVRNFFGIHTPTDVQITSIRERLEKLGVAPKEAEPELIQ